MNKKERRLVSCRYFWMTLAETYGSSAVIFLSTGSDAFTAIWLLSTTCALGWKAHD